MEKNMNGNCEICGKEGQLCFDDSMDLMICSRCEQLSSLLDEDIKKLVAETEQIEHENPNSN
jgi:hypothetical protein